MTDMKKHIISPFLLILFFFFFFFVVAGCACIRWLATVAIGHNGNLTNTTELRDGLAGDGIALGATSDTEVIEALIEDVMVLWRRFVQHML